LLLDSGIILSELSAILKVLLWQTRPLRTRPNLQWSP